MVSHPETGSDSPIGSDRDRGRDIVRAHCAHKASAGYTLPRARCALGGAHWQCHRALS